jgi:alpha-ketoglutarate-dependent 2,4-dichlorophenoxyacetate dioxygenase
MPWTERKLSEHVGIELTGLRIGPGLSQADRTAVYDATARYGVTVIPGQDLNDGDIAGFADSLADPVYEVENLEGVPDSRVTPLGNVDLYGNRVPVDDWILQQNRANELWHIDLTFMTPRATISMLYGRIIPPSGGDTEFCDTRLLWESLSSAEQERLRGLRCWHSIIHSRQRYGFTAWTQEALERFKAVPRPLVQPQPRTGRTALTLASHIQAIDGLSDEATLALVDDLTARATVPENVYTHRWSEGDFLLWDNRCVMHRARPFDLAQHSRDVRAIRLFDPANV